MPPPCHSVWNNLCRLTRPDDALRCRPRRQRNTPPPHVSLLRCDNAIAFSRHPETGRLVVLLRVGERDKTFCRDDCVRNRCLFNRPLRRYDCRCSVAACNGRGKASTTHIIEIYHFRTSHRHTGYCRRINDAHVHCPRVRLPSQDNRTRHRHRSRPAGDRHKYAVIRNCRCRSRRKRPSHAMLQAENCTVGKCHIHRIWCFRYHCTHTCQLHTSRQRQTTPGRIGVQQRLERACTLVAGRPRNILGHVTRVKYAHSWQH